MIVTDASRVGPWVCERAGGDWVPGRGTALGWEKDGQLVGGVLYEDWNGANVVCHIAGEGKWLSRQFLWAMFDYPFNQLKVKRITGTVPSVNLQARKFDEHLGFVLETTLKDAHPEGDLLIYVMTRDMCPWLKLKDRYGKE